MNPKQEIMLEAAELPLETSKRITCPFCKAEHEKSMSITRIPQGILYNCYRNSCRIEGGFMPIMPSSDDLLFVKKEDFTPNIFKEPTMYMPKHVSEWLSRKYGMTEKELVLAGLVRYAPVSNRIIIPLRMSRGYEYGIWAKRLPAELRDPAMYESNTFPKVVLYLSSDQPRLHFTSLQHSDLPVVLVEDVISAEKYSAIGIDSVALLGTHLAQRELNHLATVLEGRDVIIHLDPDAKIKARTMCHKYSLMFKSLTCLDSDVDPKEMSREELGTRITERSLQLKRSIRYS